MGRVNGLRFWLEYRDGRIYRDPVAGTFLFSKGDPQNAETEIRNRARAREARGLGPFTIRRALAVEPAR